MAQLTEAGVITGTADKDYNLIWFTETCLSNALRLETYIEDARRAGDEEAAAFFARAQTSSIRGAEEAKSLLRNRLVA
ncbi:hypothetical protein [Nocardioides jiangxiensis]|uniref:Uncharacterized protein n=1 Tax=Nocardioides jiangxiensis TaxID=3064524 RepID=A0ABT9AWT6_9ACTN|nr:hypothetical protein [Nocardioides sp. WY-20]MDO7866951.1 hypothetical protein [Nocardioides sp. WY-20]